MEDDDTNDPALVTETGRRLLKSPSRKLIDKVYNGSYQAFKKCVIANFPGCDKELEEEE